MCRDKIQDMYVGQEFKNYKHLCEFLGEKSNQVKENSYSGKNGNDTFHLKKMATKLL